LYVNNVFRQQQKSQQQQNTNWIIKILNRDGNWTRDLWTKDSGMPSLIDVIQYMYMNDFMSWIHYLESTFDVELRDSPHLRTAYRFIVSLRTAYGLISIKHCVLRTFNNKINIFLECTCTTILANVRFFGFAW